MQGKGFMKLLLDKALLADIYVFIERKKKILAGIMVSFVVFLGFYSLKQIFYDIPNLETEVSLLQKQLNQYKTL